MRLIIIFVVLVGLLLLVVGILSAQDNANTVPPEELADPNGVFLDVQQGDVSARIYAQIEGNPDHPAVILLHGFGGATVSWRGNLGPIAEAGFYVVAMDLPPFGLSSKSPDLDYSRSGLADMVAGTMDALDIETATIVGHSMGGAVTAHFAIQHAERVEKLVFVAGAVSTGDNDGASTDQRGPAGLDFLNNIDPESTLAQTLLRTLVTPDLFANSLRDAYADPSQMDDETALAYQRPLRVANWEQGFLAFLAAEQNDPVVISDLSDVKRPTLILWGREDTWVPLSVGDRLAEALPNAQRITYDDVGHLPMEENAEAFNEDLIAFLQGA